MTISSDINKDDHAVGTLSLGGGVRVTSTTSRISNLRWPAMANQSTKHEAIHDQTNILTGARLIIVFSALASALLVAHMDQNAIGVVLPTIGRELGSSSTIVWAGTSSFIANTSFQVLYGRLSDIFGRKVILLTMLGLLAVGDLLCSQALTGPQLYAFRGISGLANGGVFATVMMVVSDITTLEQRGK